MRQNSSISIFTCWTTGKTKMIRRKKQTKQTNTSIVLSIYKVLLIISYLERVKNRVQCLLLKERWCGEILMGREKIRTWIENGTLLSGPEKDTQGWTLSSCWGVGDGRPEPPARPKEWESDMQYMLGVWKLREGCYTWVHFSYYL